MSIINTPPIGITSSLNIVVSDQPVIFDNAISKKMTDVEKGQLRMPIWVICGKTTIA